MISKAIETALKAHQGQPRKGTEIPYSTHPLAVGIILAKAGCTDDVIAAGILHDTVEDTDTRFDDLRVKFGAKVATIVEGCSEPNKKAEWEERKQHTIDSLKGASPDIKFVSLADKFHNISSMASDYAEVGERLWDRFKRGRKAQKGYYEGLVVALRDDNADEAYGALHKEFSTRVEKVFGAPEMKEG
ncbi:MAG: bifunctional (p)ppGpp synthetase/guanosine-3',5'-bis(diphosphate) 3'-pyrophosphohydrolase [Nitrospina sp.]|nr:bifunctional (p)ppGpp synthetase/guanosine-3',5'-bis(diphosphate) 3'-pyrophosphohydrolase [Nitrospina sp.]